MTHAQTLVKTFWNDQSGFIISAELVLISTLLVLGLIVGMSSVQSAVVGELEDIGSAIGSLNQSYSFQGFAARRTLRDCGYKAYTAGSVFQDLQDDCDASLACHSLNCGSIDPTPETASPKVEKVPGETAEPLSSPQDTSNIPALST